MDMQVLFEAKIPVETQDFSLHLLKVADGILVSFHGL